MHMLRSISKQAYERKGGLDLSFLARECRHQLGGEVRGPDKLLDPRRYLLGTTGEKGQLSLNQRSVDLRESLFE